MWVKICANTNVDDALAAVELGADALGFVFAPSKRQVTAQQVAAITPLLPPDFERVGVFLSGNAAATAEAVRESGLNAVQMHGGVNLEFAANLRTLLGSGISLIHVAHWDVDGGEQSEQEIRRELQQLAEANLDERVLVDAKRNGASGGLGVSFDWERARAVFADFPTLRIIVAGGLRPGTVAEAVNTLRPYGVDVASGVEAEAGRKDPQRLAEFIKNARRA